MAYVYTHTRKDTGEVFYVGIGKTDNHLRAYTTGKRNRHWQAIANKTEYYVTIIYDNLTWDEACEKERELIAEIGRSDLKNGPLVNWTNGGEGSNGAIVSEETKRKITLGKIGKKRPPVTQEARQNLSLAMKGKLPKNFHTLHTGVTNEKRIKNIKDSFSKKSCQERSARWYGSKNPRTTEVVNLETGIFYDNLQDAWKASGLNISRPMFSFMLLGTKKNSTSFQSFFKQ